MAALCYSPIFSISSQILCAFRFSVKLEEQSQQFRWETHRLLPRNDIISTSSSKNPRVSVKVRAGKSVKSNDELCNDLREFVSMVGLPEGYVPSFKELLQHGRKDLANIVRRRGYKLITELLTKSTREDTNIEISSTENQDVGNGFENEPARTKKWTNWLKRFPHQASIPSWKTIFLVQMVFHHPSLVPKVVNL